MGTVTQGALSDLGTVQNADAMTVMGYDARRIQQYELRELARWDVAWIGQRTARSLADRAGLPMAPTGCWKNQALTWEGAVSTYLGPIFAS
jgi:hypothetical protein